MLFPKAVKPGATVGLVCPSSPITPEQQEACRRVLTEWGFRVKESANLTASHGGYMAGDGKLRARELNAMFADPEVDVILCCRGGDGVGRAIPYMDRDIIRRNPKPFIGYSDITGYHLLMNQDCGLGTFHGPMCSSNMVGGMTEGEKQSLWQALTQDDLTYIPPEGSPIGVLRPGRAEGVVTGGNLSLVCAFMGTPLEIDTRGKLLFLEDVHEPCYSIDRMMWHLLNAGKLQQCAGILLGQFTQCDNRASEDFGCLDVFREATENLGIPVMYNIESGHGAPMMTIPMGAVGRMDTKAGTLTFHLDRM